MATSPVIHDAIANTVDNLHRQFRDAVRRSAELHRDGAEDDAVLTETALAVNAAKALECLTGRSWEERLAGVHPAGEHDSANAVRPSHW